MRIAPIVLLVACSSSGTHGMPGTAPDALAITASAAKVAPGSTVFFTASADGKYLTDATWSSSNPAVLTVEGHDGGGAEVTGVAPGMAAITATAAAGSGTVAFEVVERFVVALAVTAGAPSVAVGLDVPLTAVATFDDGTTADVTGRAAWSSTAGEVAPVSAGWVRGVATGSARISASLDGQSASATIAVVPGLQSIDVAGSASVVAGRTIQLIALARFADGSSSDVTSKAAWTVDDPLHATVTRGLVVGLGAATVHATARLGGLTGTATVDVAPAVIVGMAIHPAGTMLAVGSTVQMTAVNVFSDGSEQPATDVAWRVGDLEPAFTTVSPTGLVTGAFPGNNHILVSSGILGASSEVVVTADEPTTIEIQPANLVLRPSAGRFLQAIATYPGGQTLDVTRFTTWASSDPAIARITDTSRVDSYLRATSPVAATTTISATVEGVTGETQVQVQP